MSEDPHPNFLDYLHEVFGTEDSILKHPCPRGGPDVRVYVYRNCPEPGMITGVTHGLSLHPHPDWGLTRPELIISVESKSEAWPYAAAFFAAEYRSQRRFAFGEVFTTDGPLTRDTQMNALLVHAQRLVAPARGFVQLPDYRIDFVQLYPLHQSEVPLCRRLGLDAFWQLPGVNLNDPRRVAVKMKEQPAEPPVE